MLTENRLGHSGENKMTWYYGYCLGAAGAAGNMTSIIQDGGLDPIKVPTRPGRTVSRRGAMIEGP